MVENKPLAGLQILVMEDIVATAVGTWEYLTRLGAAVDMRANVAMAKKRLEQKPFDLVIIDYQVIGKETGTDLALWMHEQPSLKNTLRVSYSGSDPQQILAGAPADVYHAVIPKTIPVRELADRLIHLVKKG